jgi:prephenate dehydrogenase
MSEITNSYHHFGLAEARVAILGLGLMGGSLAMALRNHCAKLLGADPSPAAVALARKRNLVHRVVSNPEQILPQADIVILAAPVRVILDLIDQLPHLHPGRAIVLDIGSTKVEITRALAALPERFDPLGGHPMCGKETAGLENADPAIFQGAPFAFTPLPRTSQHACCLAEAIARAIGSHSLWLDPATHDEWVAATSHLPYLLSAALVLATPLQASSLAGPGFRSTSRLAASTTTMMVDVLSSNQVFILEALRRFRIQMDFLADSLSQTDLGALEKKLAEAAARHRQIISNPMGQV